MQDSGNTTDKVEVQKEEIRMPLYELKAGGLQGSIYQNSTDRGEYFSILLSRTFIGRDGETKTSYAIREQDISLAMQVLTEANRCIQKEREHIKDKEPQVQVTRTR